MQERVGIIRLKEGELPVKVKIIDEEQYWPGVGRAPNHDKIAIEYPEQKEKVPNT